MFQFLGMAGNYEARKVGRDDFDWGFVSTCYVNDGVKDYETAVKHKAYGEKMTIVENYDSKEQAAKGHAKWLKKMTAEKLPDKLIDCMNAEVAQVIKALSGGKCIERKRKSTRPTRAQR